MSSIIKNKWLNVKEESTYFIDPDKVKVGENDSQSTKDLLKTSLNDLEEKIKEAELKYDSILKDCENKINETDTLVYTIKEQAYNTAYSEGYNEGKISASRDYNELMEANNLELSQAMQALQDEKINLANKLKNEISNAFYLAFENILNVELSDTDNRKKTIDLLILRGLNNITDEKEVKVVLSENDYKVFDKEKILHDLGQTSYNITFSFKKDLKDGDCILETDLGYIDVGIENLKDAICTYILDNIN